MSDVTEIGGRAAGELIDLGPVGIFCLVLLAANVAQFYFAYLERRTHKDELKERNDLLASWAERTSRAVADGTAASAAASAATAASAAALVQAAAQMQRSDIATARAVERLAKLESNR